MYWNQIKRISSLIILCAFTNVLFGQFTADEITYGNRMDLDNSNSWAVGGGFSNFIMHGDMRSIGTGNLGNFFSFGAYAYADKMFNPLLGIEVKATYSKISGGAQYFSDVYSVLYVPETVIRNNMYFEGALYGGEFNLIFSFTNLYQTKAVKWHSAGYFGVGYHQYNSQLFEKNITGGKDTPIVDFGTNPARNSVNAASSIYLSAQLGVKRRISKKLDLELRSGMYFNYEDHLDATISNKQNWETFFVTSIGVVMNIGKNKVYTIWDDDTPKQPNFQIIDTDKDGVMDQLDKEPNTPPGVMVYGNGVGIDSDKDGIQDHVDSCPLKYGPLSNKGCPLPKDSDQDGIIDVEDLCPLVAGTVSNKGCPLPKDTDQDGIIDVEDLCPLVPGTVSNKGCPEDEKIQVAETVEIENKIALFATNIYFDTNSDQIQKISLPIIAKIIGLMKKVPNITFIIEGHTDDRSSKQYNLELSQRRANAIKKYISNAGIDQQRLEAKGFGELQPKFSNQNLNGRKLNRRVEIKPTGKI